MKRFLLMLLCLLCSLSMTGAQADINLPASLTVIGEEAFAGDSSISGMVEVSGNVYRIRAGAFSDTNLTGLDLSSSVTYIEDNIVAGSPAVYVAVVNPDAVLSDNALSGASVILSREGSTAHAWAEANNVEWYNLGNVIPYGEYFYEIREDGTAKLLFAKDADSVSGSVKVPITVDGAAVTEISEHAFSYCSGLQSVSVPDTVDVESIIEGNHWPELEISSYATGAEPILPSEEYVELDMSEQHLFLPVGLSHWISESEDAPEGYRQWYSSNDSVASVSQYGEMITHTLGDAAITMVIRGEDAIYTGIVQVHVVEPEVEITLGNPDASSLLVGQTNPISIQVDGNLSYTGFLRNSAVFTSSNEEVFTCTGNAGHGSGFITGVAPGTANLIVEISHGDFSQTAEIPITVRNSELGLNYNRLITYSGLQEQLVLLGDLPEGASTAWYSEDENLITVDETGLITLHEVTDGMYDQDFAANTNVYCEVTYTDGSTDRFECLVFVYDRDPYIGIDENPMYFYVGQIGNTSELPVYMDWMWVSNHTNLQPEAELTFESNNSDILYFAEDGTFHANQEGTVNVTVYGYADIDNGLEAVGEFTAEVYQPTLDLWLEEEWDEEGEFWFINLEMTDTQRHLEHNMNHDLPLSSIEFSSSDTNVVKISSDGYLEPVAAGSAEVTMTITDISGQTASAPAQVSVIANAFTMELESVTLNVGETSTLVSMPELEEGVYVVDDHFYSDDEGIACFDNSVIYGISAGSTYVHHEVNLSNETTIYAKALVTVVDPDCPVKLSESIITLEYSQTYQLEATFDGEPESVVWSSSDEGMAIVDENGLVTLVDTYDHGNLAIISCTAVIDGEEYTACCTVKCPPLRVWFRHFQDQLQLGAGETHEIEYQIATSDPELEIGFVWSTEDENIATIDENGVMHTHGTGITGYACTIIDAADGSTIQTMCGRVFVNVAPDNPTAISFDRPGYLITMAEDSHFSGWEFTHMNVNIEADYRWDHSLLRYSSDNKDIVTVDEEGNLTGVAPGVANVTVTMAGFPNLSDTVPVIVAEYVELYVSNTNPCVGEEITIGLHGMPFGEGDYYRWMLYTDTHVARFVRGTDEGDLIYKWIRNEGYEYTMGLQMFGEYDEDDYYNYHDYYTLELPSVWVEPYRPEYPLSDTVVYLGVGDEYDLWPEFGHNGEKNQWSSDNEGVAYYDEENGRVVAVGAGSCIITLSTVSTDEEGNDLEAVTASCEVIVEENPAWRPVSINVPSTIIAGRSYGKEDHVYSRSYAYPETRWESSNPGVLFVNDEHDCLDALQPGTVELTLTAFKNGEEKSVSKIITVVDVPLRMTEDYTVELRPGQTKQLSVIAGQGKEIESVEWKSNCASLVTVDGEGNIKAIGEDGLASIYATATFTDGTTYAAHAYVEIVRDDEIWFEMGHMDDWLELSTNGVNYPVSETWYADFFTNASLDDLTIEWRSHNEEVVKIGETDVWYMDNGDGRTTCAVIEAVSEGDAQIECIVYSDELDIYDSRWLNVHVYNPTFDMVAGETSYTVKSGTSFCPDYRVEQNDGWGPIYYEYESSDTSIARANVWNDIQAGAPGEATITYRAYHNEVLLDTQVFYITVEGALLDCANSELNVGETTQMIPTVVTHDSYDNYYWTTSDPSVATVSNDGTVVAMGGGSAAITYHVQLGSGEAAVTHTVDVFETEEADFYLVDSFIDSPCERGIQLEYVSNIGEPNSVEWSVHDWGEIDENGLLYLHSCAEDHYATVTCTATFGKETYTDTCLVRVIPEEVWIGGFDGVSILENVGDENYWGVSYEVSGKLTDVSVELVVDDPSIAGMFIDENETLVIRGLNPGATTARYIVHAPSGHTYEKSVDVYVATELPTITEFEVDVDTLLLFAPDCGPFSERGIPWHSEPVHIPFDIKYASDNTGVVEVDENGHVRAVAPGKANITITLPDYPDFSTVLPVVVAANGDVEVIGLEEGVTVGDQVQLSLKSTDDWHTYANDITFNCYHNHDQVQMTEDGLVRAFEPGENWNYWVNFDFCGQGVDINPSFNSYRDDEYFYAWHTDDENLVHPGQEFWPDVRSSFDIHGWKVTSEDESIIATVGNGDHWIGVNPGTTTVTYQAYTNEEHTELYSTVLTAEFTVREPEAPVFSINTQRVIRTGETWPVDISVENWYYNGPDYSCTSSDENILVCDGHNDGFDCQTITAVAPGKVTLTVYANYGDSVATETVEITVIAEAPAWVNSTDVELRPGYSKQLSITPAEGKTIEAIEWVSSNPAAVFVDQNGMMTAGEEGHVQIMAYITFSDGSFFTTTTKVGIAQDDGLWIDFHGRENDVTLGLNENYGPATSQLAHAFFNSNLAEEEVTVTWTVEDDSIVTLGETNCGYNGDGCDNAFVARAELIAVKAGGTNVTVSITSEFGHKEQHTFWVDVVNPYFSIKTNNPEITVKLNEFSNLDFWFEGEHFGQLSYYTLVSSDENIVTVDTNNTVAGAGIGTATVTIEAYADNSRFMASYDFTVNVVGPIELNTPELTLPVGESAVLSPSILEELDYEFTGWSSDNDTVASISSQGTVIATGIGNTHVRYNYRIGEEDYCAYCLVVVPYDDGAFRLNESIINVAPTHTVQLSYISETEPDSVEWFSTCGGTPVDQNGLVSVGGNECGENWFHHDIIYCIATFGNEVRSACCTIAVTPGNVCISGAPIIETVSISEERYIGVEYRVTNGTEVEIEFQSDDPSIAELDIWEDDHMFIRGNGQGVTNVHILLHGSDGSLYTHTITVYVDTPFPVIESFEILENPMIIKAGDSRWTPWVSQPEGIPCDVSFSCEENSIVNVREDGWIEGLNPGRMTVHAEIFSNPDLSCDFDVVVLGDPTFTGLENDTMQAGTQAQLRIDFGDYAAQEELDITFESHYDWNHFRLYEDGTIQAYEPGEYDVWVHINGVDYMGYSVSYNYRFTVERPDEYFYTKYPEFVMYANNIAPLEICENIGLSSVTCEFDPEGVVRFNENNGNLISTAIGETNVTITGLDAEGNPYESEMHITVIEAVPLDFEINVNRIIHVGETVSVYVSCDHASTVCPGYLVESSDDAILLDNGDFTVTGVTPGTATLTVTLGTNNAETVRTTTIYVIE